MLRQVSALMVGAVLTWGCDTGPEPRRYPIRGQILELDMAARRVTLKHDAVEGYMDAMTMPFVVGDGEDLTERRPGELVAGLLEVADHDARLVELRTIGFAEIATPSEPAPSAASGFELLTVGSAVPDQTFVDQDGRARSLAETRGKAVALTFIYTRCPLPTFCPMMDRHFAAIQQAVVDDPRLEDNVRLLSISFDPEFDTPAVLKRHAAGLEADPALWSFLTGERDEIDRFAARFGVTVTRAELDPRDIGHNLRTIVLDREGRIESMYVGYDWAPSAVLQDLRSVVDRS